MRIGILLAAGRGRRMGRTKQLLDWPVAEGSTAQSPKPLVAAAFDAVAHRCDAMVVVLGHEAEAVGEALGDRDYMRAISDPDEEMFHSVRAGLEAAQRMDPGASVLLQPGDHPEVHCATLEALIQAFDALNQTSQGEQPAYAVMPEFQGRGGHPVLIPALLVASILRYNGEGGLRQFWVDRPQLCWRVPVDDLSVVLDLDRPADYRSGPCR